MRHSYFSVRLTMERVLDDQVLKRSIGTGFLWDTGDQLWLITNVHNLTGWNFERNCPVNEEDQWIPNRVILHAKWMHHNEDRSGFHILNGPVASALLGPTGDPLWRIHPLFRNRVDVAALPIGKTLPMRIDEGSGIEPSRLEFANRPVNTFSEWFDIEAGAGDEVYVLGYPKGMDGGSDFPIWKRGSIASEPLLDRDGLPQLLIDTATRQGMSGSPVLVFSRGWTVPAKSSNQSGVFGTTAAFLGVYSGRIGEDELGVQLGIVWKAQVVDEIVCGATQGTQGGFD